ncbi:MAG: hypothetical protein HND50_19435 [Calditrichaeota bacterium]|nr:hypothetical protein [Calditrichota bacterium]
MLFFNRSAIIALFAIPIISSASNFSSTILSQNSETIRIKFLFEEPVLIDGELGQYAFYKSASLATKSDGTLVPVINKLFSLVGTNPKIRIVSQKQQSFTIDNYSVDKSNHLDELKKANVAFVGKYRDLNVFSINIVPVEYTVNLNKLTWTEEIVVEVSTTINSTQKNIPYKKIKSEEKFLSRLFLNGDKPLYSSKNESSLNKISSQSQFSFNEFPVVFKITIDETGLYKVDYEELSDAGFPVTSVNPQNLSLYNQGSEVPIYFRGAEDGAFGSSDYFEFWGKRNEKAFLDEYQDVYMDPFSNENVYWLIEKTTRGLRLIEESGSIVETDPREYDIPFKYEESLHFEKNSHREIQGNIKPSGNEPEYINHPSYMFDHWYWGGPITAVGGKNFEFHLPYPYDKGNSVYVKAMFRGSSLKAPITNWYDGHQVAVWLDVPGSDQAKRQKVGEIVPIPGAPEGVNWVGQKLASISNTSPLSQGKLQHGTNIFSVVMDQEGFLDAVLFNWFDITYQREYIADNNFIKFKLQDGFFNQERVTQFQVKGFSTPDIDIYKIGLSKIVNGKIDIPDIKESDPYRVIIQDLVYDPNVEYVAVTEDAKKKALSIEEYQTWKAEDTFANLLDKNNSADLIIITNQLFSEDVKRLASLKEQAGYTVETVNVSQIYDIFNSGIKSPLAIKDFLKYAYNNWDESKKLRFVIFAGDASFDPNKYISKENDLVPVLMFTTSSYGAAPADLQYSLISGDDLIPDISVGRIPATTTEELNNYIDKIEEYQSNPIASQWRNKALFISGADSTSFENFSRRPAFRAQSTRLIRVKLPQNIMAYKLNTKRNWDIVGIDPEFGHNRELIEYIDDGVTFINFFGHGGGGVWSDNGIFDLSHVEDLNNKGQYPFIASMTCFTGAFENPGKEGLAEKILVAQEKGAIAVLASSSVGWTHNDFAVKWALHDFLWQSELTFGESVDLMKINYLANPVYYTETSLNTTPEYSKLKSSMVNQYNLLGDPTLILQKPANDLSVSLSTSTPTSGQQIQIKVNSPNSSGLGVLEISDEENVKYLEQNFSLNNSVATIDYNIPDSSSGLLLKVKVYTTDGNTDASGNALLNVEHSIIKNLSFLPEMPQVNEEINFQIVAKSHSAIEHMELRKFRSEESTATNNVTLVMNGINDSLFQSASNYPGFNKGGLKYFEVFIRDVEGNETIYELQKVQISDDRPDLELDQESIKYSGNDQLQLSFNVFNNSDIELQNIVVNCYDEQGISSSSPFYTDTLLFIANETKTIYAPYSSHFNDESRLFRVEVDPANAIQEKDENNNGIGIDKRLTTDHLWIDYRIGSSLNGGENDTVSLFNDWGFHVPANGLNASTVVSFESKDIQEDLLNSDQKDLKYIRLKGSIDTSALIINIKNSISQFNNPATISAFVDTALYSQDVLQNVSFLKFNEYLGLWVKIETDLSNVSKGGLITTQINSSGQYGVFVFDDQKNPFIEITANGRSLRNDVLLSANPSIAILLQDENGIDLENTFSVLLNDNEISKNDLTIPDSIESANSIAVLATPELEKGSHTLEVKVADINGNLQSIQRTFSVSSANDLVIHGNYPNPFTNETIISYTASISVGRMDKLSIKIYSVSGHLVRSEPLTSPDNFENIEAGDHLRPDYHELLWDGTDDNGNDVANGVYFVVLKATFKDNSNNTFRVNKKLKVARLK